MIVNGHTVKFSQTYLETLKMRKTSEALWKLREMIDEGWQRGGLLLQMEELLYLVNRDESKLAAQSVEIEKLQSCLRGWYRRVAQ